MTAVTASNLDPESWRQHDRRIRALVDAHGGLELGGFDRPYFRSHARRAWAWDSPPG